MLPSFYTRRSFHDRRRTKRDALGDWLAGISEAGRQAMNPFEAIQGRDFDHIASSIQCRIDRAGAEIYVVNVKGRDIRVMAHSKEDAENCARARHRVRQQRDNQELSL